MQLFRILLLTSPIAFVFSLFTTVCGAVGTTGMLMMLVRALHFDGRSEPASHLHPWMGLAFASTFVLFARSISRHLLARVCLKAIFQLRLNIAYRILGTPLVQLERIGSTRLLAVFTHDLPIVAAAAPELLIMTANLTVVLGAVTYLAWLSPVGTAAIVSTITAGGWIYVNLHRLAALHSRRGYGHWDDLVKKFHALVHGIKELQVNDRRRQHFIEREFVPCAGELRRSQERSFALFGVASTWAQGLFFIVLIGSVVEFGGLDNSSHAVAAGFGITVMYAMTPLQALLATVRVTSEAGLALERLQGLGLLSEYRRRPDGLMPQPIPRFNNITLSNVSYHYPPRADGSATTLGPIDLTLRCGEIVFVTGSNGAGKTTLAKLLTGLYLPEAGEICLDGSLIESDAPSYRNLFAVVFSDLFVFPGAPSYRDGSSDELRARALLARFGIDHVVQIERGHFTTTEELSTAQRKRLALVSAWLDDRPILLLDEWAAEQDAEFKKTFYREVLAELKRAGKTVVVINHDHEFQAAADRILLVKGGQVADVLRADLGDRGSGQHHFKIAAEQMKSG